MVNKVFQVVDFIPLYGVITLPDISIVFVFSCLSVSCMCVGDKIIDMLFLLLFSCDVHNPGYINIEVQAKFGTINRFDQLWLQYQCDLHGSPAESSCYTAQVCVRQGIKVIPICLWRQFGMSRYVSRVVPGMIF